MSQKHLPLQEAPMEMSCTSQFPRLMDQLLVEALPAGKMQKLKNHLHGCTSCQKRYNRIVMAGRLLDGGPGALGTPSAVELQRVGAEVLRRARLVPDLQPPRRTVLRWVGALAAAGLALAIALPLALRQDPRSSPGAARAPGLGAHEFTTDELAPRGPREKRAVPPVGMRAFCIRQVEGAPQVTSLIPTPEPARASGCGKEDILKFAYTNRSELGFLFLFGLDEQLTIKWYEPHPPQRTSIPVKRDVVDEPLSRAVRLAVNHGLGQLRIFAIFSAQPRQAQEIEAAVARARQEKVGLEKLAQLPLEGCTQRSILVKLQP